MKHFIKVLVCLLLLSAIFCVTALASENYTASDILTLITGILDRNVTAEMDITFDGVVDLKDVLLMLKMSVDYTPVWKLSNTENITVSTSGSNWWDRGVQYPRLLVVNHSTAGENGTILATFEELNSGLIQAKPGYPIYKSTDEGATWEKLTTVRDNDSTIQSEWNPHLFELEAPLGEYKAGTILLAGCSIDAAHSKKSAIRLYASTDGGKTFGQPITVAEGGGDGEGVWEPFLLQLDDGRLVCFYSDDSASKQSQKIVYKVSSDGVNFGEAVDVVASKIYDERPGMPVVTRFGNGTYFMVYEVVNCNGIDGNPVFFRTSSDGLNFGDPTSLGTALVSKDGKKALGSAPYCVWSPIGGKQGTLIVSGTFMRKGTSDSGTDYFVSTDGGKTFTTINHLVPYDSTVDHVGYSNSMALAKGGKVLYAINNPVDENNPGHSKIVFGKAEWFR